jgi:hypothetical protein
VAAHGDRSATESGKAPKRQEKRRRQVACRVRAETQLDPPTVQLRAVGTGADRNPAGDPPGNLASSALEAAAGPFAQAEA